MYGVMVKGKQRGEKSMAVRWFYIWLFGEPELTVHAVDEGAVMTVHTQFALIHTCICTQFLVFACHILLVFA
jgi:hypothetical protein